MLPGSATWTWMKDALGAEVRRYVQALLPVIWLPIAVMTPVPVAAVTSADERDEHTSGPLAEGGITVEVAVVPLGDAAGADVAEADPEAAEDDEAGPAAGDPLHAARAVVMAAARAGPAMARTVLAGPGAAPGARAGSFHVTAISPLSGMSCRTISRPGPRG
jgi:hypothetical protein